MTENNMNETSKQYLEKINACLRDTWSEPEVHDVLPRIDQIISKIYEDVRKAIPDYEREGGIYLRSETQLAIQVVYSCLSDLGYIRKCVRIHERQCEDI